MARDAGSRPADRPGEQGAARSLNGSLSRFRGDRKLEGVDIGLAVTAAECEPVDAAALIPTRSPPDGVQIWPLTRTLMQPSGLPRSPGARSQSFP